MITSILSHQVLPIRTRTKVFPGSHSYSLDLGVNKSLLEVCKMLTNTITKVSSDTILTINNTSTKTNTSTNTSNTNTNTNNNTRNHPFKTISRLKLSKSKRSGTVFAKVARI